MNFKSYSLEVGGVAASYLRNHEILISYVGWWERPLRKIMTFGFIIRGVAPLPFPSAHQELMNSELHYFLGWYLFQNHGIRISLFGGSGSLPPPPSIVITNYIWESEFHYPAEWYDSPPLNDERG